MKKTAFLHHFSRSGLLILLLTAINVHAQTDINTDKENHKGLKDYFRTSFPIGVAVSARSFEGSEDSLIRHQFNSLTPENAMKMGPIHPEENTYHWKEADFIVARAMNYHMKVRGHNLCWHEQTPSWLFKDSTGNKVTKDVLLKRLKDHITTVVSRYQGKIYAWDVVNEAISDDSTEFLRKSDWFKICGDEFIVKAFEYAHEADPKALLFYNDYNTERPEKRERVYRLMKQLVDAHVPIYGIGLQGHWSLTEPTVSQLSETIERFASLGLKVQITELDISMYPWEKEVRKRKPDESDALTAENEQKQIDQYAMVFNVFRKYRQVITGITFWNVSDQYSWLDNYPVTGRKNYPLLFDQNLQPKKAYQKVIEPYRDQPDKLSPVVGKFIIFTPEAGAFPIVNEQGATPVVIDSSEYTGVIRAVNDFRTDIFNVTGVKPVLYTGILPSSPHIILVGTPGKNRYIDELIRNNKLNVSMVLNRWETYQVQTVHQPFPGINEALVILGSDKRGAIYGLYEISSQAGVSPWYWWADVPIESHKNIFVLPGIHSAGEPAVKYRGIFINDEAPALSGWAHEKFGGLNHVFYEKVFELILRLKGNYLWPAMWGNAFNDDDKMNPVLADEYGIVMGTSHHEPMLRAQQEWKRYGAGPWNYDKNEAALKSFWTKGIANMGKHESIVTIGMRGDGDEPMSENSNILLLERIVKDQRQIIESETGKKSTETPQLWALYKEVQDYYDKGMRVPDDITLLLCDDNWGNIRKLPHPADKFRTGGYGIYYHFDYVGDPRNYKWLNTNPISRVWEQMRLAYDYDANKIWIVNVGDIKPMEFPISFFMDYAWNPDNIKACQLHEYTRQWAAQQFGENHASSIAVLLSKYTLYNGRKKPELLTPETYSLTTYNEAEHIATEYSQLAKSADSLYLLLPGKYRDAFFQLVLYPVKACAIVNEMYVTCAQNHLYATQGRSATNALAETVKQLYRTDSILADTYNKQMSHGKWNHMMDQTHIGYTYWQQPTVNKMPMVKTISIDNKGTMGLAVERSEKPWSEEQPIMKLPGFSSFRHAKHYFEIFNKGQHQFKYTVKNPVRWIHLSSYHGTIEQEQRIWVEIDWPNVPKGNHDVPLTVSSGNKHCIVMVSIIQPKPQLTTIENGHIETLREVSFDAEKFTRAIGSSVIDWEIIPEFGRTCSGVTTYPVNVRQQNPLKDSIRLEYNILFTDTGKVTVQLYFSPTLDFASKSGLTYAISMDNEQPRYVSMNISFTDGSWAKAVSDNIKIMNSDFQINTTGTHTLKFWIVDPGLVLQKVVLNMGGVGTSYLGPDL